jgi:hypothetical protein
MHLNEKLYRLAVVVLLAGILTVQLYAQFKRRLPRSTAPVDVRVVDTVDVRGYVGIDNTVKTRIENTSPIEVEVSNTVSVTNAYGAPVEVTVQR